MKKCKELIFLLPAILVIGLGVIGTKMNVNDFSFVKLDNKPSQNESKDEVKQEQEELLADREAGEAKGTQEDNNVPAKSEVIGEIAKECVVKQGTWKDGTYTGSSQGFGGLIVAEVTIKDGKILSIVVTEHDDETTEFYERASVIIEEMVEKQTPNVDAITGATYSSNGIKGAVINALNKAVTAEEYKTVVVENKIEDNEVEPNKKKEDSVVSKQIRLEAKCGPKDGVYEGSSVCERFLYTVNLKVKFKDGKAVAIYGLEITDNDDEQNEKYWKTAWKAIVKKILMSQSNQVDAVTGATYSSNAIVDAYVDAYNKAIIANGNEDEVIIINNDKAGKTEKEKKESDAGTNISIDDAEKDLIVDNEDAIIVDGVYEVSALCEPDEYEDFEPYTMYASFKFKDGILIDVGSLHSSAESNARYYTKAAWGNDKITGVIRQLIDNQSASKINAVSGATCSSKTMRRLYLLALNLAKGNLAGDEIGDEIDDETDDEFDGKLDDKNNDDIEDAGDDFPKNETGQDIDDANKDTNKDDNEDVNADEDAEVVLDGALIDGKFTVTVMVWPDEWEDFNEYQLVCDMVFENGKLKAIDNLLVADNDNRYYCELAVGGRKDGGMLGRLSECTGLADVDKVDCVSGATCTSLALKELYKQAYDKATTIKEEQKALEENEIIYHKDN